MSGAVMANLPSHARVVIIGGGVVGISVLYHLGKAGWRDCVLLEKDELTAGSTWHAAGNCPNFSTSWTVMNMQRYGLALYRSLADDVDYPINYHVTGSIRLAHGKQRMQEFEHVASMARRQGLAFEICTPKELQERNPFIKTHDLAGGLWDPLDGDIDPAQLTQALAKGARTMGQYILRFTPAISITRENDEWVITTDKGTIRCEYVVNAAGYYAGRIGEMFKPHGARTVPMVVMSHQYFLTGPIPELEAWTKEHGRKMPIVRDVDTSYYLRQEKFGLNLGPYERNCRAHWVAPDDPMPENFSFQLFPDDLDRLEWYIEDAMARVPLLGAQGVERVFNGPIPYAPDGLPLLGPMPGVKNAFEAHSFTFGIAQAGGAGKILCDWITEGGCEWDTWALDPRRFTDYADPDYCHQKAIETYGHEYAMHFPRHTWPAGSNKKLSSLHDRLLAAGGEMGAYNGWERVNWFAKDGDDTSKEATQTWARNGPWQERVRQECEAVRDHCGVIDLTGFSRFTLKGDRAADFLARQITGRLPKIGRIGLGYFADHRGRIITEMTIMRHDQDAFTLMSVASAEWHDFEWLKKGLPQDRALSLTNTTADKGVLLVTGPKARDLLSPLTGADLSAPARSIQTATMGGVSCLFARISFTGELGWEIHAPFDDLPALYDAVVGAGATPFGMFSLDCLRLEKAYRAWKTDLSSDYSIIEAGLSRFIAWEKPDFVGKKALSAEKTAGIKRRFVVMTVDADEYDAPPMAALWKDGIAVGEVTSGGFGYRVNCSIALGMVETEWATPGASLEIEIYGRRYRAVIQGDRALWDPENERICA